MKYLRISAVSLIGLTFASAAAHASTYYYADWTTNSPSSAANGSATGTFTTLQGTVTVTYSGDVVGATQVNNIGTDYYTNWQSVYTNSTVANSPTNVDLIALSEAQPYTDTLTFSTPITNPIVDIVSLGSPSSPVSYLFNATPTLLSQGSAYWGGCSTCLSVTGNTLTGTEGDGVLEFSGTFNSLSWTTTGGENWNGFTVGVAGEPISGTPEPATWISLVIAALLAIPYCLLRNKLHLQYRNQRIHIVAN